MSVNFPRFASLPIALEELSPRHSRLLRPDVLSLFKNAEHTYSDSPITVTKLNMAHPLSQELKLFLNKPDTQKIRFSQINFDQPHNFSAKKLGTNKYHIAYIDDESAPGSPAVRKSDSIINFNKGILLNRQHSSIKDAYDFIPHDILHDLSYMSGEADFRSGYGFTDPYRRPVMHKMQLINSEGRKQNQKFWKTSKLRSLVNTLKKYGLVPN